MKRKYDTWDLRKLIAFKSGKSYTVLNDETKIVLNEYELLPRHIRRLWRIFINLDKKGLGYITVDHVID